MEGFYYGMVWLTTAHNEGWQCACHAALTLLLLLSCSPLSPLMTGGVGVHVLRRLDEQDRHVLCLLDEQDRHVLRQAAGSARTTQTCRGSVAGLIHVGL